MSSYRGRDNRYTMGTTAGCVTLIILVVSLLAGCQPPREGTVRETATGDSLSFIVIGDWGVGGSTAQQAVAEQMDTVARRNNVQFIITTGDNFYPTGVLSADDPQWQRSFEKVYDQQGHMIPWYPTLGNHDYNGSVAAQVAYSRDHRRWRMTAPYYALRKRAGKASVVFAFADMNPFIKSYYNQKMPELKLQDTAAQYQWLQQTLSAPADWKIMIGHQPLYSAGSHGGNTGLVGRFKPLLLQTNTDFYLAGHDHNLQHIQLAGEKIHYLVSGGGGRGLYGLRQKDEHTRFALSAHGFLLMTLYPDKANITFYGAQGQVLYQYQVRK